MCVTNLTCHFDAFDDEMVVSLTRWTLSALENYSEFSFAVTYLECVSGGRRNLVMSYFSDLSFLYGGQILFVERDWKKSEWMESHHFGIWIRVLPSWVMGSRCLVNCDGCEWNYVDLRRGHLMISAEGCCLNLEKRISYWWI